MAAWCVDRVQQLTRVLSTCQPWSPALLLGAGQDVVVSMEQTRFRLLALSAVCPGASTLIGNLVKSSGRYPACNALDAMAGTG